MMNAYSSATTQVHSLKLFFNENSDEMIEVKAVQWAINEEEKHLYTASPPDFLERIKKLDINLRCGV